MRFAVSRVMDMIERRLTTDVELAQAVVDIGEVAGYVALDHGRPVSVTRLGLVIDALSRYLVDAGAMLYPVAARALLSESALTSKERMVLSRWADSGIIEVTPVVDDRAVEIADLTGLPLVVVRPYTAYEARYDWLRTSPERQLWLRPKSGGAVLAPGWDAGGAGDVATVAIGKAAVTSEPHERSTGSLPAADEVDGAFRTRGAIRVSSTRVISDRFTRAEPSVAGVSLLAREWRCLEAECSAFGGYRTSGQPVPSMRAGVPICPRHEAPLTDIGPRPPAFPMAVVVDDLSRHRFAVDASRPVGVGRSPADPEDIALKPWLHSLAAAWIAPTHLELSVRDGGLHIIDISENGTLIWKRSGPEDQGSAERLHRTEYRLGQWDTVELYTGVELAPGNRHRIVAVGGGEVGSVMVDAPTVVIQRLDLGR